MIQKKKTKKDRQCIQESGGGFIVDVTKTGIRLRPKASYPMPHNFLVEMCGVVFRDTLGRLPKEQAEEIFGRVFKAGSVAEEVQGVEEKQEETQQ